MNARALVYISVGWKERKKQWQHNHVLDSCTLNLLRTTSRQSLLTIALFPSARTQTNTSTATLSKRPDSNNGMSALSAPQW